MLCKKCLILIIYSLFNGNESDAILLIMSDALNISTNMLENSLMRNQKEIKKKFNVNLKNFSYPIV